MKSLLIEYRLRKLEKKYNESKHVGDIYHVAELSVAGKIADSDQLGLKDESRVISIYLKDKEFEQSLCDDFLQKVRHLQDRVSNLISIKNEQHEAILNIERKRNYAS